GFDGRTGCHHKELLSSWRFYQNKQEDDPDVIEKPEDLSEEDYEAWVNVNSNLEKAENYRRNDMSAMGESKT
ncbi:hypothetical protein AVEN_156798-1, partial [Araneus ventricosus]